MRPILCGLMGGWDGITWTDVFNGFNGDSTFARNSVQNVLDIDGALQPSPANVAGIEGATFTGSAWTATGLAAQHTLAGKAKYDASFKGYLNEPARTNLFLQSAAPATQNVTTSATSYAVSCVGSGSIVLVGTITGTVTEGTPVIATATAGTLTLTVVGTLTHAQVEAGAFVTSPITTTTATVTRPVTNLTRPTSGVLPVNNFGIWGRVRNAAAGQALFLFSTYVDASNYTAVYYVSATSLRLRKRLVATDYVASVTTTQTTGEFFEYQAFQSSSGGHGIRVKLDSGAWSAWVELTDANGVKDAAVGSTFGIGYYIGGTNNHFAGNYPFLAILTDSDPKSKLELAASLYPTS